MDTVPLMRSSEAIVRHVGVLLFGALLALAIGYCIRLIWAEMAWTVFFCVFVAWGLGNVFPRYDARTDKLRGRALFAEARKQTRFWPNAYSSNRPARWCEYILNVVSTVLAGFVLAILVGGLVAIVFPSMRISSFWIAFAICLCGTIGMINRDRLDAALNRSQDKD
jgi:hypothetical protein